MADTSGEGTDWDSFLSDHGIDPEVTEAAARDGNWEDALAKGAELGRALAPLLASLLGQSPEVDAYEKLSQYEQGVDAEGRPWVIIRGRVYSTDRVAESLAAGMEIAPPDAQAFQGPSTTFRETDGSGHTVENFSDGTAYVEDKDGIGFFF